MKLSGHKNYASFQMYLHARRETTERARDVIRSRDGNLTGAPGNGVSVGIGGTVPFPLHITVSYQKRQLCGFHQ